MKRSELKELLEKAESNPTQCDDEEVVIIDEFEYIYEINSVDEDEGQIVINVKAYDDDGEDTDDDDAD